MEKSSVYSIRLSLEDDQNMSRLATNTKKEILSKKNKKSALGLLKK